MDSNLFELGKELGFTGDTLLAFVEKREKLARDEAREDRLAVREDRKQEEKLLAQEEKLLEKKT